MAKYQSKALYRHTRSESTKSKQSQSQFTVKSCIRSFCRWLHAGNLLAKCLSNNWCHFSFSYDGFSYCVQTGCFNWYLSQIPLQFAAINSFWSLLRVDVWLKSNSSQTNLWLESEILTRVEQNAIPNSNCHWLWNCDPYDFACLIHTSSAFETRLHRARHRVAWGRDDSRHAYYLVRHSGSQADNVMGTALLRK